MSFRTLSRQLQLWTLVSPRNHILDGIQVPHETGVAYCKVSAHSAMAGPVEIQFVLWTCGPWKHVKMADDDNVTQLLLAHR